MKFELPSRGKISDLKHSAALNLFQKKLCYRCNYLGVIHFEYIGSVRRDGKFAGSMINHFSQIVLMDEKANDSLCCEIQRGFCKVITYLFDFYFL